jgi:hypothetical protein
MIGSTEGISVVLSYSKFSVGTIIDLTLALNAPEASFRISLSVIVLRYHRARGVCPMSQERQRLVTYARYIYLFDARGG